MQYALQVFSGSWHETHEMSERIIRRIDEISSRIPVNRVIIGWKMDSAFYSALASRLHQAGIKMLLWLPVFTEVREVGETEEALDLSGRRIVPSGQAETAFAFDCPSSRRNIAIVEELYEKNFADCGFDGVFLDRIRSQSFAAGVPGVLSCGCEKCRKAYQKRGVDTEAVWKQYTLKRDSFFDIASYPANGQFILKDPLAQRFFEAKEEIIAEAASEICRFFKEKGLIVGLDLFAPFISRLAGQNYTMITQYADFIKPMLYRRTEAPAGIEYEYRLFEKHAPGAQGRKRLTADKAFLDTQLEAVRCVPCESYPGIELNYSNDIVRTDAEYITESLAAVKEHGFGGVVLSWNVVEAPDKHIEAVKAFEQRNPDSDLKAVSQN